VPGVLGQDVAEMLLAEDQHVVEALTAKRPHEPLRERVHARRLDSGAQDPGAAAWKTASNEAVKFARSGRGERRGSKPCACWQGGEDGGGHALSPWPPPGKIPVKAVPHGGACRPDLG
jgi:hypothetical protein